MTAQPKARKRVTDKERLDWLEKLGWRIERSMYHWSTNQFATKYKTARAAIDAAIQAERSRK